MFTVDPDVVSVYRSVYSYYDLAAEIGGLIVVTYLAVKIILVIFDALIYDTTMQRMLIGAIFSMGPWKEHDSSQGTAARLLLRRKARLTHCQICFLCCCCKKRKARAVFSEGEKAIAKELDLVNFIRLQKQVRGLIQVVFNGREQAILRQN